MLPLADMDAAFTAAGVAYLEVGWQAMDPTGAADWRTRGRPASTGPFVPEGVLCHHTASPEGCSPANDLATILSGYGDAPGPISQLYIGRDAQLYLVAAGRANHGGRGIRPGVDGSCADMNAALVGIEVGNNGVGEPWSDAVTDLYAATVAALCEWYGWATGDVYLHATTGPPSGGCNSKIDPAGPWQREPSLTSQTWNLDTWRAFVDEHRGASPGPGPSPVPTSERRKGMSDFVILYGMPDVPDGSVYEVAGGKRRHVSGEEWWEVLKGVVMAPDGSVPIHDPWQPVAFVANGYVVLGMPEVE